MVIADQTGVSRQPRRARRSRRRRRGHFLQTGFVEAKDMQLTTGSEHLNRDTVIKTYARWAPIYDKVFGSVFEEARRAAVAACEQIGGRVLEVGVGTGISLPYYSSNCHVTGIDISEEMLEVARQRVADDGLQHVERLELMDAEHLAFADGSFDVVVAQYVVTHDSQPGSRARRVLARAAARRRACYRQPGRRGEGATSRLRSSISAFRTTARLALKVRVGAL